MRRVDVDQLRKLALADASLGEEGDELLAERPVTSSTRQCRLRDSLDVTVHNGTVGGMIGRISMIMNSSNDTSAATDAEDRSRLDISFSDSADRWLDAIERKQSTIASYRSTVVHGKAAFGSGLLEGLALRTSSASTPGSSSRRMLCPASTRAKHLRVLGACLQAAVFYRYADSNAVRELPPAQRPRPERKEAAYFENAELPHLFACLVEEPSARSAWWLLDGDAAGRVVRAQVGGR